MFFILFFFKVDITHHFAEMCEVWLKWELADSLWVKEWGPVLFITSWLCAGCAVFEVLGCGWCVDELGEFSFYVHKIKIRE